MTQTDTEVEEQLLNSKEAQAYLGIYYSRLSDLRTQGIIQAIEVRGIRGKEYHYARSVLEAYKKNPILPSYKTKKKEPQQMVIATQHMVSSPSEDEEEPILITTPPQQQQHSNELLYFSQAVQEVSRFIDEQGMQPDITGIRRSDPHRMRLWEVETPTGPLSVIMREDAQITILADQLLRQLQERVKTLEDDLRFAQQTIIRYQAKPREITMTDFAYEFTVFIRQLPKGFEVYRTEFTFTARGETEEEALANYRLHLRTHYATLRAAHAEKPLTVRLFAEMEALKELLWDPK